MKVAIEHKEYLHNWGGGLLKKGSTTKYYQVECTVMLDEEEKAIIAQRDIGGIPYLSYHVSADVRDDHYRLPSDKQQIAEARGALGDAQFRLAGLVRTTNEKGNEIASHGTIRHNFYTPLAAKNFEQALIEGLRTAKGIIMGNKELGEPKSFEL